MRGFLLKLHYYLAFVFMLPLLIAGVTGMVLVFDHALDETLNADLLLSSQAPLADRHAIDFDRAISAANTQLQAGERLSRVFVSRHARAAILAETTGAADGAREILINPQTYAVQGARLRDSYALRWVYNLHAHLLVKPVGDYVLVFSALTLVILSISGLANWLLHPSSRLHLRVRRKIFLRWWDMHRFAGVVMALMLLLIAFTGGTMAFMASFGKDWRAALQVPEIAFIGGAPMTVAEMAALSQPLFPTAQLSTVFPPKNPQTPWKLSWHQPDEPRRSKGMSHVWIDPYTRTIVQHEDPLAQRGWSAWLAWVFPLHNGEWAGLAMRWLHWLAGFSLLLLAYTGTRAFLSRRKPRKIPRKHSI